ncbi:unnamed protein product [Staurois parvus]|uniref:Uncharacterized protein n=1 Tax=Staurois parvus TaxID=386267 RepID=A0ABN9GIK8_9NEOB|nr:unnamed protein product [Staurois parvus]
MYTVLTPSPSKSPAAVERVSLLHLSPQRRCRRNRKPEVVNRNSASQ